MEYQHRRTEAQYQQPSLLCSNGTLCKLIQVDRVIRKPFCNYVSTAENCSADFKEAIILAAFRLVEYLEHQHLWVRLRAQNDQKQIPFFWNSSVYSCSEKLVFSMLEIGKKLKSSYNAVYYSIHRTAQTGSNQNRKRSGRPGWTTEQEDKYISV